ncbi:MAG: hypothetical protein IPJ08_10980 [Burkholderiales bacterium]|nr:hypothetical protein [Burkholderiales bacterium]
MSVSSATREPGATSQTGPCPSGAWPALRRWGPGLALAAAVATGAALAAAGTWAIAGVALACLLASPWLARGAQPAASGSGPARPAPTTQASGLTRQIVPVWRRNVDGARLHSEQSSSALVEAFAAISGQLDDALRGGLQAPRLDSSSIDELLDTHRAELDTLLSSAQRIASLKDEMLAGVMSLSDTLTEMVGLSKEVQTISRATHLLALNASVEAQRASGVGGQGGGNGFAVVAQEVRHLADQSRQAGIALGKHVARMQERVLALRRSGTMQDTTPDELMLQAEQNARAVLRGLLLGIQQVSRSQRSLQDAGSLVQREVEQILVNLQSQDRQSQMLVSVTDDMARMQQWLEGGDDDAAVSAQRWLERLEATYTMEDMRASHHATVKVEQATEVEFF